MNSRKDSQDSSSDPQLFLQGFLVNQSKELENNSKELDIRKQQQELSFKYSIEALNAQKEDRKEARRLQQENIRWGMAFIFFILLALIAFVTACFYSNNIQLLKEILKYGVITLSPGLGGYYFGFHRGRKSASSSEFIETEEE